LPALYDLVSVTALVMFLLWVRRRPRPDGFLILTFAVWYGTGRIIEDFFRVDVTHGTGLTGSQWASVALIVAVSVYLVTRRRHGAGELAPSRLAGGLPPDPRQDAADTPTPSIEGDAFSTRAKPHT